MLSMRLGETLKMSAENTIKTHMVGGKGEGFVELRS